MKTEYFIYSCTNLTTGEDYETIQDEHWDVPDNHKLNLMTDLTKEQMDSIEGNEYLYTHNNSMIEDRHLDTDEVILGRHIN